MTKDYLPHADAEFRAWSDNFSTYVSPHLVSWGFVAGDLTAITAALSIFNTNYSANVTAQAAAQAAAQRKDDARHEAEAVIRAFVRRLQAAPTVTDGDREAMGITVRNKARAMAAAALASRPVAKVEEVEGLRHVLRLANSDTSGYAKPEGAKGAEMYMKIVPSGSPAPQGASEMTLVNIPSTTRITQTFDDTDTGKTAWYIFRWVNSRDEKGPWSTLVSATIAA